MFTYPSSGMTLTSMARVRFPILTSKRCAWPVTKAWFTGWAYGPGRGLPTAPEQWARKSRLAGLAWVTTKSRPTRSTGLGFSLGKRARLRISRSVCLRSVMSSLKMMMPPT